MITSAEFDALFESFHTTAYRLETLPAYDVGGGEAVRLRAWREHTPRPVQSVRTSPWLARIAATSLAGKRWARTRVVDDPLTDYQRFQLANAYPEAQTAGDEIRVVQRAAFLGASSDFWLFDGGTEHSRAVTMTYDSAGHWLSAELVTDSAQLAELDAVRAAADAVAAPLNVFLNATVVHV